MEQRDFENYLDALSRALRLSRKQREEIRRELRAHLLDALDEAAARGEAADDALRRVITEFGDAAELAARLSVCHRKRRWIMHATVTAACVALAWISIGFFGPQTPLATAAKPLGEDGARRGSTESGPDAAVRVAMEKMVPDISLKDVPLRQAIEQLQQTLGVNTHVFWAKMSEVGASVDTPISVSLKNVTIERALRLVLDEAGDVRLTYAVDDGILLIGPEESLSRRMKTVVYDVRELLMLMADSGFSQEEAVSTSPAAPGPVAVPGPSAGAAGSVGEPIPTLGAVFAARAPALRKTEPLERQLVGMIQRTIRPDSWEENGGLGNIEFFHGALVVRSWDTVQAEIQTLIESLQRTLDRLRSETDGRKAGGSGLRANL
ncbi:MAG: STN domain-containing protein [Planctomycetes bacterium]|nr:STN domain-containing protein [Planctomycetota bacterium]